MLTPPNGQADHPIDILIDAGNLPGENAARTGSLMLMELIDVCRRTLLGGDAWGQFQLGGLDRAHHRRADFNTAPTRIERDGSRSTLPLRIPALPPNVLSSATLG
ncbi:hypothetical protein [Mycobacteroides abscessus]|uniref:hypothetical protein n=1 Tax=Mycobacteroides abscessus TaxID=36809 RepID=UPI000385F042|nr:hypothetical protein [Mycobacteroides abscessus]EPZ18395.1 hypothetical protein M879_21490 [Mycobacteroides abscessus V06705]MBN7548415.1 hypothetical protein [Mycobacteroides abscessus subsp. abscessus]MDM2692261.1 hypothetical protein [Mycobacteroides abscessus]MDM2697073.1 hypothetical protein [Mycobacteroides abscessus]MDM2702203.1 hypothetical protein [Mycobacteroides abscessus]